MKLNLHRLFKTPISTHGRLDCVEAPDFLVHTLEDLPREEKIPGITAIPLGCYEVKITWSQRFKTYLPLLLDVPGFTGIRIHSGNRPEHTEGCILVGEYHSVNRISNSKIALTRLMKLLKSVPEEEKIFLEIFPS